MFKSMAILALVTSVTFAGTEATPPAAAAPAPDKDKEVAKKIEDQGIYVETAKPGVVLSGYVDAGGTYNTDSAAGGTAGTVNGRTVNNVRFGADDNTRDGFNLNAFKLALEKPLGDKNDFVAGFRADLMFGQDAGFLAGRDSSTAVPTATTATGANAATTTTGGFGNDVFVEQAFVQFRAPVGNGIDFHVGRFVTPMGYEVIERPANLNISYGNLFVNMIPLYHQGVEATYKFNDTVNVLGAVVDGWNNSHPFNVANSPATSGSNPDNAGFIGQINVNAPGGNANITNTVYYGVNGDGNVLGNATANNSGLFLFDSWGNWKPKFANDKWLLGYNADYGTCQYDNTIVTPAVGSSTEQWYGVALYSKYQFTKIFSLAGRADWIHNTNGAKWANSDEPFGATEAGPGPATTGTQGKSNDLYSYTITSSFDVWENMLLRAEYRIDWGNDWGVNTGNTLAAGSQWGASSLFTAEVVYSF